MSSKSQKDKDFIRLGKYLNEVVTVTDSTGKVLQEIVKPVMFEFYLRDVLQVIVGATILAIPVAFTEEVWRLGSELPWLNIVTLSLISILFLAMFIYYNFYAGHLKRHHLNFTKRVLSTYLISLLVVASLLTIINQVDWINLWEVSLKRVIIVAFPASMSAVVADSIK